MNEPTLTQGEQPVTAPESTQASEQRPTAEDLNAVLDSASPADIAMALGFDVEPPAPEESTTQPDPPALNPETIDPQGAQPNEIDPTDEEHRPINRRRLSVTGLADEQRELTAKAIAMVREGKATDIVEAMLEITGRTTAQPAPTGSAEDQPNPSEPEGTEPALLPPSDLKAKLTELREQRAQAKREFETDEEIRLTDEIEDLQLDILRAEQAETVMQSETRSYEAEYQEAVTEMETKYANLLDDEDSPFAEMLDDKVAAARSRKDPALSDPKHIIAFADQIASRLQVQPSTLPPARQPAPVPPKPREIIGATVAPGHRQAAQFTTKQAEQFIEKASKDDLAAALWG